MRAIVALATAGALLAAGPTAPAAAEEVASGGLSCGMTAVRDELGEVRGFVTGGPWHVTPPPPGGSVTVTCTVEADVPGGGRTRVAEVSNSSSTGVVVVDPHPVAFSPGPGPPMNLYLCTEITVYDPGSVPAYRVRRVDADGDPTNGAQCQKTEPEDGDLFYFYVVPPGVHGDGDYCLYVPHGIGETDLGYPLRPIPPPPNEFCAPA